MSSEEMEKPLFLLENLVIKSSGNIDVNKWRNYFLDNIELLIGEIPKRKVVILDGVHDTLRVEPGFFEEDVKMVEWLETSPYCWKREYIDRLQVRKFPHLLFFSSLSSSPILYSTISTCIRSLFSNAKGIILLSWLYFEQILIVLINPET